MHIPIYTFTFPIHFSSHAFYRSTLFFHVSVSSLSKNINMCTPTTAFFVSTFPTIFSYSCRPFFPFRDRLVETCFQKFMTANEKTCNERGHVSYFLARMRKQRREKKLYHVSNHAMLIGIHGLNETRKPH